MSTTRNRVSGAGCVSPWNWLSLVAIQDAQPPNSLAVNGISNILTTRVLLSWLTKDITGKNVSCFSKWVRGNLVLTGSVLECCKHHCKQAGCQIIGINWEKSWADFKSPRSFYFVLFCRSQWKCCWKLKCE